MMGLFCGNQNKSSKETLLDVDDLSALEAVVITVPTKHYNVALMW